MVNILQKVLILPYIAWIKGEHEVSEAVYVFVFKQARLARQYSVRSNYLRIEIGSIFVFNKSSKRKFTLPRKPLSSFSTKLHN
jgi:hypothetical protein